MLLKAFKTVKRRGGSLLFGILVLAPSVVPAPANMFDPPPTWYLLDMAQCYGVTQYYTSGRQIFGTSASQIEAAFLTEVREAIERQKADRTRQFIANGYGVTHGESSTACEPMYHSSSILAGWRKPRPDAWQGHIFCRTRTAEVLTYPTVPSPWDNTFESVHQCAVWWVPHSQSCTVALSGPESTGTRIGEIEPGKVLTGLRAQVECNGIPVAASVAITPEPAPLSGGHAHHGAQRPAGAILPAVVNSDDPFTFNAPEAAGDHRLKARCIDRECTQTGPDTVWVGVKGLIELPDVISLAPWVKVGQRVEHPNNHYLKAEAIIKLIQLARYYSETFPNDPPLHLNDASLERGGVFDIHFNWMRPHGEHRRGVVIDVRANGTPTAIPKKNFKKFEALMSDLEIEWLREHVNQSNGHYHVRLLGIAQ